MEINNSFGLLNKKRTKQEEEDFTNHLLKSDIPKIIDNNDEMESMLRNNVFVNIMNKIKHRRTIRPIAKWTYPSKYLRLSKKVISEVRQELQINVHADDDLAPIENFKNMKIPHIILKALSKIGLEYPTIIQMQSLPFVLNGRDVIAISGPSTGKSFVFIIPLLLLCLYEEMRLPIKNNQGPFGIIIVPNRELAIQIQDNMMEIIKYLIPSFPLINITLCIGGIDSKTQVDEINDGVHIIIGTPGRLSDLLSKGKIRTKYLEMIVYDEADRLFDLGFEEELEKILGSIKESIQTILVSSNMPSKIQQFASSCLVKPVIINHGDKSYLNKSIKQEFDFIKEELRLLNLLNTLKKTPPPVLIFCDNKHDVDSIHEYLLIKGIDVCAIHGGKEQYERNLSLRQLKEGLKDVLICTDIVSKGIDFQGIEHVINYEMPKEIETYIMRFGRCGRLNSSSKISSNGIITTYITRNTDEVLMCDLRNILISCNQIVPEIINSLASKEKTLKDCEFCGITGHSLAQCHKYEAQRLKMITNNLKREVFNTKH